MLLISVKLFRALAESKTDNGRPNVQNKATGCIKPTPRTAGSNEGD